MHYLEEFEIALGVRVHMVDGVPFIIEPDGERPPTVSEQDLFDSKKAAYEAANPITL